MLAPAARTRSFRLTQAVPAPPPHLPGLIENACGAGTCLYLTGLPGAQYTRGGMAQDKRFLWECLARLTGDNRPVAVAGVETVEVLAHDQPAAGRRVVNLIQRPGPAGRNPAPAWGDDPDVCAPVTGMTVRFGAWNGRLPERIYLAPDRRQFEVTPDGGGTRVAVPPFTVHAMVVAEFGTP